jgi:Tol biopolymer transport system component
MRANKLSRYAAVFSRALTATWLVGAAILAASELPVLREIAELHARTGLTLAYVANGEVSGVSFLSRSFQLLYHYKPDVRLRSGRLSPDGSRIAFSYTKVGANTSRNHEKGSISDSEQILGIMLSRGTGLRTYENIRNPQGFCWSPDQKSLALTGTLINDKPSEKVAGLLLVVPDSDTIQSIMPGGLASSPCWSPDGSKLVYERDGNVYTWSVKDKGTKRVAPGKWPTWSPVDDSITFYEAGAYYSVNTETGTSKRLFTAKNSYSPLWWSPDGRFIAYVSAARFSESFASAYPDEVRLRIRRTADGQEDWAVRFSRIGPWQEFQWVSTFPLSGDPSN